MEKGRVKTALMGDIGSVVANILGFSHMPNVVVARRHGIIEFYISVIVKKDQINYDECQNYVMDYFAIEYFG